MSNGTRRSVLWVVIAIEVFVVITVAVPLIGGTADSQAPWALGLGLLFIVVSAIVLRMTPKDPPKDPPSSGSPDPSSERPPDPPSTDR